MRKKINEQCLIHRYSNQLRAVSFIFIFIFLIRIVNFIAQPVWSSYNYNPTKGIYEEPLNTIETLFVGSSHIRNGISPMKLYEDYGICAYDLSTEGQPIQASYYWIQEIYRMHEESLATIVLDIGVIRQDQNASAFYKSIDPMKFSALKLRAVKNYSDDFTDFLFKITPILGYHERWKELTDEDFLKYNDEPVLCLRGHAFTTSQWVNNCTDYLKISLPLCIPDKTVAETKYSDTAIKYLNKIISFCKDHNIHLVLIKTPTYWDSGDHNAIQNIVSDKDVDFIDFNVVPYFDDADINLATDINNPESIRNLHLNYYGAMKVSDYLGEYLINVCDNHDVRGESEYVFMDEELENYHRYITSVELAEYTNPCDYIEYVLEEQDYSIFIAVKDEASNALTKEQRSYFASIGLTGLSNLAYGASYLAVIENGKAIEEMTMTDNREDDVTESPLEYTGTLLDGTVYSLISEGCNQGNKSSIKINGIEHASNGRGLNIVIYDNKRNEYIDSANFDTHISPEREIQNVELRLKAELNDGYSLSELSGTDRTLYLYDRRCENDKNVKIIRQNMGDNDIINYLDAFIDDKDLDIYMSVKNDVSQLINSNIRNGLEEFGLTELSSIGYQDSYVALISGGEVIFEEKGHNKDGIEVKNDKYYLSSCVTETDNVSSIMIDGIEYSDNEDGINIVVYDNITEMVIDTISFGITVDDIITAEETAA